MSSFKDFYYNYREESTGEIKKITEEDLFFEATQVRVPSLKAFTAWLILNKHLRPTVKIKEDRKPLSVFSLKESQRVLYLVKQVPKIEELAKEFSFKWSDNS